MILLFILVMLIIGLMDSIWFKLYFAKAFMDLVKEVQGGNKTNVRLVYAIFSYIILAFGFLYFVFPLVKLAKTDGDLFAAIKPGVLWGFVVYGVFDMTNLAVFYKYSLYIACLDILWGSFLGGVLGGIMYMYI